MVLAVESAHRRRRGRVRAAEARSFSSPCAHEPRLRRWARDLHRFDQSCATPTDAKQPGLGCGDGWMVFGAVDPAAPSIEPAPRRGGIDPRGMGMKPTQLRCVTPRVQEHVGQGVANFSRRSQNVDVVAVPEGRSVTSEDAVHGACEPRSDRLHPRTEISRGGGLGDEMDMIGLDRVMGDPEASAITDLPPARLEFAHETNASEGRKVGSNLDRDVAGVSSGERSAPDVADLRRYTALPSGTRSSPTPARR